MARDVWQKTITSSSTGAVLSGAQITVRDQVTNDLVDIWVDQSGGVQRPNPFLTGADGLARFFAEPGFYKVTAFKAGEGTAEFIFNNIGDAALRSDLAATDSDVVIAGVEAGVLVDNVSDNTTALKDKQSVKIRSLIKTNARRGGSPLGLQSPINILGDSISHGAFALNLFTNSWVNILKRMFNAENEQLATSGYGDSSSYGFTPWFNVGSGVTLSSDIHTSNNISGFTTLVNENATNSPSGSLLRSTASGGIIDFTVPTFQGKMRIYYIKQAGGGSFTIVPVSINVTEGSALATVDTSVGTGVGYVDVDITDNTRGNFRYRVKSTTSGTVDIVAGANYLANIELSPVNNFSNSGRSLVDCSEQVIADAIDGAQLFICALGYNDFADANASPAYLLEFKQRVDWIIEYANLHNTPVVWLDFVWSEPLTSPVRAEMSRIETECNGYVLRLPEMLRADGGVINGTYLVDTLKMWTDAAHPNVTGHKWIAETVAKFLGLSVSSKKQAIEHYDWWLPLMIDAGSNASNTFNTNRNVSATRRNGSSLLVKIYVEQIGQNPMPTVARTLQTAWNTKYSYIGLQLTSVGLTYNTSGGALVHQVECTGGGNIRLNTLSAYTKDAIGTFVVPLGL
jgi:lysophospholipase L1-like esterase